ncbi:MAG: hypothetical protein KC766_25785, partial [Myxococcales bacterium]|nr:hypothetical protein [Myxococcales bacterium]
MALGACVARGENPLTRQTDDDAGGPPILDGGAVKDSGFDLPDAAPHAVLGVDPPHGPWSGGALVTVRGNGFRSAARGWIGGQAARASAMPAVDPTPL